MLPTKPINSAPSLRVEDGDTKYPMFYFDSDRGIKALGVNRSFCIYKFDLLEHWGIPMEFANAKTVEDFEKIKKICEENIKKLKEPKPWTLGCIVENGKNSGREFKIVQGSTGDFYLCSFPDLYIHGCGESTIPALQAKFPHITVKGS